MIRIFFDFVELRTKVASVLPFLIGTTIAYYTLGSLSLGRFILMLVSLLCIDMATTGFNHYYDYQRAILKTGYHYEKHNPISSGALSSKVALRILLGLVFIGIIFGLLLVWYTDVVVLMLGMLSFMVGLSYSIGPLPLSRTILGEAFSGFFMGGLIPFIAFYIQVPGEQIGVLQYAFGQLNIVVNVDMLSTLFFASVSLMFLIGNIMLANNICDMKEDIENKRYTLPISIGQKNSIKLFQINISIAYLSLLIGVLCGRLPVYSLILIATIPSVNSNTKKFVSNPTKSATFKFAVKNFLVFSVLLLTSFVLATILK